MPCGLYGKLPTKRDFVAIGVPGPFLRAFEPWLQAGVAASRLALADRWTDVYLRAPIWRFWLGAEVAGATTLGAVMPSVDGVGRYFPLALIGQDGAARDPPPPELDPFDGWFAGVEGLLLSALDRETTFAGLTAALAQLPDPLPSRLPSSEAGVDRLRAGLLVGSVGTGGFGTAIDRLRPPAAARVHAGMSYWWTAGGDGFPPRVASCRGMPEPAFFSGLLTGRFDELAS